MDKIIEFDGDPMVQLEKFDPLDDKIFYLNKESLDEILSYATEAENIPEFFEGIVENISDVLFVAGGIDEEGNEYPDTYIGVKYEEKQESVAIISGIYASDIQYKSPKEGETILLKKKPIIKSAEK